MPQVKEDSQRPEFRDPKSPEYRFYTPKHPKTGKQCPPPQRGFAWPFEPFGRQATSFSQLAADHRIVWGEDENKIPQKKSFLHETETNVAKSILIDYTDGEKQLLDLFGKTRAFSNPKPTTLIQRFIEQTSWSSEWIMDYFAGSGTTGHAILNENRRDGARRRFILVETGEHFESVLVPRIKKVAYCPEWKLGKPKRLPSTVEIDRSPRVIKLLRLESYDDSLANVRLSRPSAQGTLLNKLSTGSDFKEQYSLHYMLAIEARGSQSLLNFKAFSDPMSYKLRVKCTDSEADEILAVDLVETFNLMLGFTPKRFVAFRAFDADFKTDPEGWLRLKGTLKQKPAGKWWFRATLGTLRNGDIALVIWRNLTSDDSKDNLVLNEWFSLQDHPFQRSTLNLVYVNGDNNLQLLKTASEYWNVRITEHDFQRLMFEPRH